MGLVGTAADKQSDTARDGEKCQEENDRICQASWNTPQITGLLQMRLEIL